MNKSIQENNGVSTHGGIVICFGHCDSRNLAGRAVLGNLNVDSEISLECSTETLLRVSACGSDAERSDSAVTQTQRLCHIFKTPKLSKGIQGNSSCKSGNYFVFWARDFF